jgi:hypothetical protein
MQRRGQRNSRSRSRSRNRNRGGRGDRTRSPPRSRFSIRRSSNERRGRPAVNAAPYTRRPSGSPHPAARTNHNNAPSHGERPGWADPIIISRREQMELEELRRMKEEIERKEALSRHINQSDTLNTRDQEEKPLSTYHLGYQGVKFQTLSSTRWEKAHSFNSTERNYYPWLTRLMQLLEERNLHLVK